MMVIAAPSVLAHVPMSRRGVTSGLIFTGVGVGIVASGTLVPFLLKSGLQQTWLGLGLLSAVLTVVAWKGWPDAAVPQLSEPKPADQPRSLVLKALFVEYGLNAGGWVPHMLFLVDYIARGLGQGVEVGAEFWVVFGLSATVGPLFAGFLADRIGFSLALRTAFVLQIAALAIPALGITSRVWLLASSIIIGAFLTGTVALVLGRIHELIPPRSAEQKAAWSVAKIVYALCQAVAA